MSNLTAEIAVFAARHSIPTDKAAFLPAMFDLIAKQGGMSTRAAVALASFGHDELAGFIRDTLATLPAVDAAA